MENRHPSRLHSTAAISGHPLHPLLVTLPIGFLVGALLSDLAFEGTGDAFWARASIWLIGAGLAGGALAAVAGFIDFLANENIRAINLVWYHFIGNAIALILSAVSLYLRLHGDAVGVTGAELVLSILVVVIFAVTGWLGGELVFRHGVGMAGEPSSVPIQREPQTQREYRS
jgi:uncharacterized membrane protein